MLNIIPGPLTNDPNELKGLLSEAAALGDRVHIDIIDGVFADNRTIDPSVLTTVDTTLDIDYHLMVDEPINWVAKCVNSFADRIIGHIEKMSDQVEYVNKVLEYNVNAGIAVDLQTDLKAVSSEVYALADYVLIMSVAAGFEGQKFDRKALEKIKEVDKKRKDNSLSFKIGVDGGVKPDLLEDIVVSGVDEVIIGKRIFKGDSKENIKKYKNELERIEKE